jgi:hypothetical protein
MARCGLTGQTDSQAPQPLHFLESTLGWVENPSSEL